MANQVVMRAKRITATNPKFNFNAALLLPISLPLLIRTNIGMATAGRIQA